MNRKSICSSAAPVVENLESRQLLSAGMPTSDMHAQVWDGWLYVNFSGQTNDRVKIGMVGVPTGAPAEKAQSITATVTITIGRATKMFSGIAFSVINMGAGNDHVELTGTGLSEGYAPITIEGGAGNDTLMIKKFDGTVWALGDDGNDIVSAVGAVPHAKDDGPNFRSIRGGNGNDLLIGSAGADILEGGDGNDTLIAGPGDDILRGDSGNNFLICGSGDDMVEINPLQGFWNNPRTTGGYDFIFGGGGRDTITRRIDSDFNPAPVFGDRAIGVEREIVLDLALIERA